MGRLINIRSREKILVVDDDLDLLEVLKIRLARHNYKVILSASGEEAIKKLKETQPDLAILDVMLPDIDGIELMKQLKEIDKELIVIMMTGVGTMPVVIKAMKEGAYDYISKPFDGEQLCLLIQKAFEVQSLKQELKHLKNKLTQRQELEVIVGNTLKMQEIYKAIARVSERKVTVLIRGESGTGKELVAKAIHSNSQRKGHFVAVDCASLSPSLLESELFGHEKGSFTGATAEKIGRFEEANEGTLFLDEIGNLSLETQAKLLRALQEEEIRRVGGKNPLKIDIRVIAATNVDLEKMVAEGRFREDLYHRLNVISLTLPPLRERKDDIPLLIAHFLKKTASKFNEPVKEIEPQAIKSLVAYDWPGNVRELINTIEYAMITSKGNVILEENLPPSGIRKDSLALAETQMFQKGFSLVKALGEFERKLILQALNQSKGVYSQAAKLLSIDRKVLKYKMNKLKIAFPANFNH